MIVKSPSDVFFPGMKTVTPPCVMLRFLAEDSEGVRKTVLCKEIHPCAFFRKVSCVAFIRFRICNVVRCMGNVIVSAKYDIIAFLYKCSTFFIYRVTEGKFVVQSESGTLTVWKVCADYYEFSEKSYRSASFVIKLRYAKSFYFIGSFTGIYGRS